MGEEIVIELPDSEPENEGEGLEVAEEVIIDELAALREAERERTAADILAAAILAQAAHDLAQGAHDRIDEKIAAETIEAVTEVALEAIAESEPEPEPMAEIEPEPEPEHHEDKKPNREHWFYR